MAIGRRIRSPVDAPVDVAVDDAVRLQPGTESAYRNLADHTTDIVLEVDAHGVLRWVSPSIARVLGHDPVALVGSAAESLWVPDDPTLRDRVRSAIGTRRRIDDIDCRVRTVDGGWRWMSAHVEPVVDEEGFGAGCIVGIRDVHATVVADRARRTLSAGSGVLVRVDDEDALLQAMCQVAVDAGGYAFAWYGRSDGDPADRVRAVTCTDVHGGYLDAIGITAADDPMGRGPVGRALRTGVTARVDDLLTDPRCRPWHDRITEHGFRSAVAVPVRVDGHLDGAFSVYATEPHAFDEAAVEVLQDFAGQMGLGVSRIRETARLSAALSAQSVLLAAIEHADEAVVVADPTPRILYANAAAVRGIGLPAAELVGRDPRALSFRHLSPAVVTDLVDHLMRGEAWRGQVSTARPDGTALVADGTVTPVARDDGDVEAYVVVMRDVTAELAREDALDREHHDRAVVLDIFERVRPSTTVEETAEEFCRAVQGLTGFDGAMVIMFQPGGRLVTYAAGGPAPVGMERGQSIVIDAPDELIERTRVGAWVLDFADPATPALLGETTFTAIHTLGATATAYAPIRWGGEPAGVLSVISFAPHGVAVLSEHLPILAELGSFAGLLFGAQAEQYSARENERREVRSIIETRAFRPVFQPVVAAGTGAVRGYEALTRFDDGLRPDLRIGRAHAAGLGPELERACAEAALAEAGAAGLPPDVWVAINFSPACVLDGTAAAVVAGATVPVVVEVTEHARIESYPALREAFRRCNARVAVDDAGAGFASLRHILELRPDIVKLDIGLVRGIDTDPARQALAAGLCEFAVQTGTTLIAEGIETEAEAATVRRLGVDFLQGHLLGRPGRLGATEGPVSERDRGA